MRISALLILMCLASIAGATDRMVGLLTLPQVLGEGPCDRFTPREVSLYRDPEVTEQLGLIRVDRYWHFPEAGG